MKDRVETPTRATQTVHILTYGRDQALVETRCRIIAWLGFEADSAHTADRLYESLSKTKGWYGLCVLCHTVPLKERADLYAALTLHQIAVYQIVQYVEPHDFVETIFKLLPESKLNRSLAAASVE